jgi:hypothetical protein
VTVLRGISFDMSEGQRLGVTGGTGSGKTTLLHCLAGLRRPDEGEIRWSDPDRRGALCASPWHLGDAQRSVPLIDADAFDCPPELWSEALGSLAPACGWLIVAAELGPLSAMCDSLVVLEEGWLRPHGARPDTLRVAEPGYLPT